MTTYTGTHLPLEVICPEGELPPDTTSRIVLLSLWSIIVEMRLFAL